MKRTILVALVAVLVMAAPASANPPPSIQYCSGFLDGNTSWNGSLRGGGSLAPDNDVKRYWDWMESLGWNIVRVSLDGYYEEGHILDVKIRFHDADPALGSRASWFACWDNRNHGYPSDALYHDD